MHYLVTGHTGFKGAWLTLLLTSLGHEVSGYSLDPEPGSVFNIARLHELMAHDFRSDIREGQTVRAAIAAAAPDVVIHLAAQPLVRESYLNPRWTMETNVNGTLNVLEAVSSTPSVKAQLIITTDKVYRNVGKIEGYIESDPLGGSDPYSSSKAMADILTSSWIHSLDAPATAIARAGNVIGGGDVCKDRLVPDMIRAFTAGQPAVLRNPESVRPWQHVLDCLSGYVKLVDQLLSDGGYDPTDSAWNFGPEPASFSTVGRVADLLASEWGDGATWTHQPDTRFEEAVLLTLDSEKARRELGWRDQLTLERSTALCVEWAREINSGSDPREIAERQLTEFLALNA